MADRVFGHIPGNPPGSTYRDRRAAYDAEVHRQLQAGICGGKDGADSIVVSGGYVDDQDQGDVIIYTGHGGRDPSSGRQVADQNLTHGNLGLVRSHLDGFPVRVIRGHEGDPIHSPQTGYRYDGLFRVDDFWHEIGKDGFRIWRFRLVALDAGKSAAARVTSDSSRPPSPSSAETTVQRIIRNTKVSERVKILHDYACQVCGIRLETPGGPYAEAAQVRPLSAPHNGPDELENLLCVCPNDHIRFDTGSIYIDSEYRVWQTNTATALGKLRLQPGHQPDRNHIAYHRRHFGGPP